MLLNRDDILNASDLTFEDVEVPEWGGKVRVRCLTAAERDRFEAEILRQTAAGVQVEMHNLRAKLCGMVMVDEQGNRLFNDAEIDLLGGKSASALQRVFEVAMRLSRFTNDEIDKLAQNLKNAQPGGSPIA